MKKRKTKRKNNFDKFFLLNWRKIFIGIIAWFLAVFLHNAVYAFGIYFGGENFWGPNGDEAFFFIIALIVIPVYFLISVIYTLIKKIRKGKW
jgi:membrane protein DedA with SNARE-associated domain